MDLKNLKPSSAGSPTYLILLFLVLGLCLLHPPASQATAVPASVVAKSNANETQEEVKIPEDLSPEEVDEYLKGLSDEQARQLLGRQLKQNADDDPLSQITETLLQEEDPADQLFHKLTLGASVVIDQVAFFLKSSTDEEKTVKWKTVINRLSGGLGGTHVVLTLLIGFAMIAGGIVVERVVLRLTANLQEQILSSVTLGKLQRVGRFFSRILLELLGIGAYVLTTFILLIIFYRQEEAAYWIISELLIVSYYFMIIIFAARVIMAPKK